MLEKFSEKIMSKKEYNNSDENDKNVKNEKCNNNTGWILFYLIWAIVALWAVYLSYKCNRNLPTLQRFGHAFLALIFSFFYIIYIFFFTNCFQIKATVPSATPSLSMSVTSTSQTPTPIRAPATAPTPIQAPAQSSLLASTIKKNS